MATTVPSAATVEKESNLAIKPEDRARFQAPTKPEAPGSREWAVNKRTVPMEVLVLGLCRTGTYSIMTALEQLGYSKVYHMKENFIKGDSLLWVEAMKATYDKDGEPFTIKEWDHLLGDYAAVSDIPASMFPEELQAAYPNAKVILTTRSLDGWLRSMEQTVTRATPIWGLWYWMGLLAPADPKRAAARTLGIKYNEVLWWNDFPRFGARCFREHEERVKRCTPPDNLLVFEAKDGWEPLCKFLGKEIPDTPYPNMNDTAAFRKMISDGRRGQVLAVAKRVATVVVPVVVLTVGVTYRVPLSKWWRSRK